MRKLKIAGAALNQTPIDWDNNLDNIISAIYEAKLQQVDILCLPELCLTGYGCEDLYLSDWVPEKAVDKLFNKLLNYCDNIVVSVGLPVKHKGSLYNCACLIENRKVLGFTAKQILANDGVHYEKRWFKEWASAEISELEIYGTSYPFGDVTYHVKGINIAFEICEDAWHEETRPGIRHCKVLNKLDLILNPSASHFAFAKTKFRQEEIVLKGSKKFNCTYLYTNLLGNEAGRMIYDGDILIAQEGVLIQKNVRLSYNNVDLVSVEIDFDDFNNTPRPSINEDPTEKEYEFRNALTLALFDYLRKSKSKGFTLSLSGGADSTICAVMVSEMVKRGVQTLGLEKFIDKLGINALSKFKEGESKGSNFDIISNILHCAYQSTKNSSEDTLKSASEIASEIGASFYHWGIDEEVRSYRSKIEKALDVQLDWDRYDIALQNIQARARSPIIWMLANIKNCLLITTSNRSEGDVGYATMDGDTSGSIAPIAAVDKKFIREWLIWAEKNLGYQSLKYVNNLSPSAELRPLEKVQTDEDDLMPYPVLLEIEKKAIKDHLSPVQVFNSLKNLKLESTDLLKQHIIKFYTMWCRNQWKRERIALSFHLDDFNVDPRTWCRFPILCGNYNEELEELRLTYK